MQNLKGVDPGLIAQQKCLHLTNQAGSSLYYSMLFLTPEQKLHLAPIIAFSWRVERIPRFSTDMAVIKAQLGWWSHEIEQAWRKKGSHPIAIGLAESCSGSRELQKHLELLNNSSNDCQIDNSRVFQQFCIQRRKHLIKFANQSLKLSPFSDEFAAVAAELLTLLDLMDGFYQDARHSLFYFPLEQLIELKLTTDLLMQNPLIHPSHQTNSDQVNAFWEIYLRQISQSYQKLWLQKTCRDHPLALCVVIYAGIRIKAWKKRMQQSTPMENLCYNLRPQLGPLEKFWLSWRIKSRWTSSRAPLPSLT